MSGPARGLLGILSNTPEPRGGGILPSIRTTYPAHIARQLHALAESRPDPETYARERASILEAAK